MNGSARVEDEIDAELALRRTDFAKIVEAMVPVVANLGYGPAVAELLATQFKPELEAIYERYRPPRAA